MDNKSKFQDIELAPMHTVEHLLNGTISELFKCSRAFTTHIEKKKSKIDFFCDRSLSDNEIIEIENKINDIISQNVDVTEAIITVQEAGEKFDLSRLPSDVETLRIVSIGDFDSCPCIGTHVSNSEMIDGKLKITASNYDTERGVMRVIFKIIKN